MWTSVGFVFAVFVVLGAHVNGRPHEVFSWNRNVMMSGKPVIVKESAEVFDKFIVMKSDDYMLGEAGIYRSVSYHDFESNVLAIRNLDVKKNVNVCLLTTPKTDFDTTLEAIVKRSGSGDIVEAVAAKNYRVIPKKVHKSGSDMIDNEFCDRAIMYKLVPVVDIKDLIDIGRTQCIWNPLQYGWPTEAPAFQWW